jgi:hypothetical protein
MTSTIMAAAVQVIASTVSQSNPFFIADATEMINNKVIATLTFFNLLMWLQMGYNLFRHKGGFRLPCLSCEQFLDGNCDTCDQCNDFKYHFRRFKAFTGFVVVIVAHSFHLLSVDILTRFRVFVNTYFIIFCRPIWAALFVGDEPC